MGRHLPICYRGSRYRVEAQNVWLRSANRNNAYNVFRVNSSGNVNNNNAYNGNRCAPDRVGYILEDGKDRSFVPDSIEAGNSVPGRKTEPYGDDAATACGDVAISVPDPLSFSNLLESTRKCKSGVVWKFSVARFWLNRLYYAYQLYQDTHNGTYIPAPVNTFIITLPKKREIVSSSFRDRVYQRALNDFAIYPTMSPHWITDNAACQDGKGTDFARNRLNRFLHEHYMQYGCTGVILKIDVRGYYDNMSHEIAMLEFERYCDVDIANRVRNVFDWQYPGEKSFNPGSQMVQIAGISCLNRLDHLIKDKYGLRHYLRYMDDLIFIVGSEEEALKYLQIVIDWMATIGLQPHPKKTKITPVTEGVPFLGFKFRLTTSGKVIRSVLGQKVKEQRRHLRKLAKLYRKGRLTKEDVDFAYAGCIAHITKGNSYRLKQRMDKFYKSLWLEV